MSSLIIKLIALLTMTIDHAGVIIFENNLIFRYFGRISFPLFSFLLVEGYLHTKNNKRRLIRYLLSILLLALLSEPIYDYLFFGEYFVFVNQNVLFELFIGLICLIIYDKFSQFLSKIFSIIIIVYISLTCSALNIDYGTYGILLIFGYYLIRSSSIKDKYKYLLYLLTDIIYILVVYLTSGGNILQIGILLSLIPIIFYNGEKGYKSKIIQYSFYLYYPIHLLILMLFKMWNYVML